MAASKSATTKSAATETPDRYEGLEARVTRLEAAYEAMLGGRVAEISQEERDRITLSRRPNSYPEAVEWEAARERQAERDRERGEQPEEVDAAEAQPSTPPSPNPPVPPVS